MVDTGMIGIIDYGLGNPGSIKNMLRFLGVKSIISSDPDELDRCRRFILPGVGAFDAGMSRLNESGLTGFIQDRIIAERKPLLGICLGMQLLGRGSEEGSLDGLGLIPFDSVRFDVRDKGLKVPHMGWNIVDIRADIPIVSGIEGTQRYYFVHSYHARCDDPANILMTCEYGYEFAAAVYEGNVIGVQFHPEKSHRFGMKLLESYAVNY